MISEPLQLILATAAATLAGAVNAVAGAGTLITFPTLVALGIPPLIANQTNAVALLPGTLASTWGYRGALSGARAWTAGLVLPSFLGGVVGALFLTRTPERLFSALVPYLVLTATLLFLAQGPITRALRRRDRVPALPEWPVATPAPGDALPPPRFPVLAFQFVVAIYGGYFGAGIGIMMLAALGFMGLTNIHQMNGLKNWGATCINLTAAAIFVSAGGVRWPVALSMAGGAIVGGYGGAGLAQRVGQTAVRRVIVIVGLAASVWLLVSFS